MTDRIVRAVAFVLGISVMVAVVFFISSYVVDTKTSPPDDILPFEVSYTVDNIVWILIDVDMIDRSLKVFRSGNQGRHVTEVRVILGDETRDFTFEDFLSRLGFNDR
ncbi:MAG: hypothetical protein ACUZ9M_00870 [Candidatus Scalindua sp.]